MRPLLTSMLVIAGLLGACADDGETPETAPVQQDQQDALGQRPAGPTGGGSTGSPGVGQVCPAIALAPDGKCEPRDLSVPCPLVDPDCQVEPRPPVACTKIWKPADGRCDLSDPCAKLQDEDCQGSSVPGCGPTEPTICPAVVYETNGKCEAPPECASNDPVDCAVACIAIRYADNGKCEAAKGCESSDPVDCGGGVVCIDIRYADNGKCEAAAGCEANDPIDCRAPGTACIEIRFADNGKCEAAKGCEYTDPVDCRPIACTLIYRPRDGVCPANDPCDPDCNPR